MTLYRSFLCPLHSVPLSAAVSSVEAEAGEITYREPESQMGPAGFQRLTVEPEWFPFFSTVLGRRAHVYS